MLFKKEKIPEIDPNFTITVDDLHVQVGPDKPLNGVSFEVEPGEYMAITGPSGSGKTTLANYILGMSIANHDPQQGGIRYGDVSIFDQSEEVRTALRSQHFGYVPQQANFLPGTPLDNIVVPLGLRGLDADMDMVEHAATILGVTSLLRKQVKVLSTGEKQRLSIVRALAGDPSILILDEPTAALDPPMKQETNELFDNLVAELDKTVVVVTHEATHAPRILNLVGGQVESDTGTKSGPIQWSGRA